MSVLPYVLSTLHYTLHDDRPQTITCQTVLIHGVWAWVRLWTRGAQGTAWLEDEYCLVEVQQELLISLLAALLFLFHVKYSIHSYSYVLQ